ncbi:MAG: SDR family oxidoreductase [Trueperaceae bacterium]
MRLQGKIALVTGASRGIGAAIARAYGAEGALVGCLGRNRDDIRTTSAAIESAGGKALPLEADVTDPGSVERAIRELTGDAARLDLLVVNAGINVDQRPVEESDPLAWQQTIAVNLTGAYHCIRLAIPYLKSSSGGRVVTIGSGTGHHARNSNSSYICSKAALWALTRLLSDELAPYGISVNELIPGPVRTEMTVAEKGSGSVMNVGSEWIKNPDDVVPLALYLASCPAPGPSGQTFSLMRRTG